MQPIYDSWDESYKQPFGAVARRSECIFSIFMPKDIPLDDLPVLVLFRTGTSTRFPLPLDFPACIITILHLLLMVYAATSSGETAITAPWKMAISFS